MIQDNNSVLTINTTTVVPNVVLCCKRFRNKVSGLLWFTEYHCTLLYCIFITVNTTLHVRTCKLQSLWNWCWCVWVPHLNAFAYLTLTCLGTPPSCVCVPYLNAFAYSTLMCLRTPLKCVCEPQPPLSGCMPMTTTLGLVWVRVRVQVVEYCEGSYLEPGATKREVSAVTVVAAAAMATERPS